MVLYTLSFLFAAKVKSMRLMIMNQAPRLFSNMAHNVGDMVSCRSAGLIALNHIKITKL